MAEEESQPDIEIYLKRAPLDDITDWLRSHFDVQTVEEKGLGQVVTLTHDDETLQCLIVEKVAKGGYASVWFKENRTPWHDDLQCAEDAHKFLGVETRCSVSGWDADQDDTGGWYRITDGEITKVNWLA